MKGGETFWLYLLACLVVPLLWGWLVSALLDWWEGKRRRDSSSPPIDYQI